MVLKHPKKQLQAVGDPHQELPSTTPGSFVAHMLDRRPDYIQVQGREKGNRQNALMLRTESGVLMLPMSMLNPFVQQKPEGLQPKKRCSCIVVVF
eukprot:826638-Rhodomonas_salina.1